MKTEKSYLFRRLVLMGGILLVLFSFGGTLFYLQIVNGKAYAEVGSQTVGKDVMLPAARGEILDRNGVPLVVNKQTHSVIFEAARFPSKQEQQKRNVLILNLIRLFESHGAEWLDDLPLAFNAKGEIEFLPEREKDITFLKSKDVLWLNDYATAQNCMDGLIKLFQLEEYAKQDARKVASVCFSLRKNSFRVSAPYTFAENVPAELVAAIKEENLNFPGVSSTIVPKREYMVEGWLAPHILGRIGAIDEGEYAKLKEKDASYQLNDQIGKSGIEASMESYLRGAPGTQSVRVSKDGQVETVVTKQPQQGNTLILSLDIELQKRVYKSLEKVMQDYRKTYNDAGVPPAGAAVVLNCKTGEVLSAVSYPSYDITQYAEKAADFAKDPMAPLWDRALMSTYSPGSTIKPSVALAALDSGAITPTDTFHCSGSFYYGGHYFKCDQSHVTRNVSVVNAISESCNIFFYNTGLRIGIDKMNEYRTLLGLGQKTGVELPEATGILDSPAYRQSIGQTWLPGFTVQAAIAQANNSFSAIQMANYVATIANGGTRYVPHMVKAIKSYDFSTTVLQKEPEIAAETKIKASSFVPVKEGMWKVANTGSCRRFLADLDVVAAAKTGTNQGDRPGYGRYNSGFLISFAPYDDPEIATFILCEGFKRSYLVAEVAKTIYDYYFSQTGTAAPPQSENTLLS